jgi:hypothetical protein
MDYFLLIVPWSYAGKYLNWVKNGSILRQNQYFEVNFSVKLYIYSQ